MENFDPNFSETNQEELSCHSCSATLSYAPGTTSLKCKHCGALNEIESAEVRVRERDFFSHMNMDQSPTILVHTVSCSNCGATTTFDENVTSGDCAYCGSVMVIDKDENTRILKPEYLLAFRVKQEESFGLFKKWIKGLWLAPNKLKRSLRASNQLKGIYIPYWTYDADTMTHYRGQRGDEYYTYENYTTTGANGKTISRTRRVTHVNWRPATGTVYNSFDDVLVPASNTLPRKYVDRLEPWDLNNLVGYEEKYLAGFVSEIYSVSLKDGLPLAQQKMEGAINNSIRRDIGGDRQTISYKDIRYQRATFKHILLPIYLSSYEYRGKVYRFLINGRTGEVQGERPWSFWKILGLVLLILAIGGAIAWFAIENEAGNI